MEVDSNVAAGGSLFTAGEERCCVDLAPTSKRAMFVDDEQYVLDGLKRTLHSLRSEWQIEFSASGEDALRKLAAREFDVIVTDMRMPGMSGAELLTQVLERSNTTPYCGLRQQPINTYPSPAMQQHCELPWTRLFEFAPCSRPRG
jgi:CheY-like chemotaxis protein